MNQFTKVTTCATSTGLSGQSLLVFRHPTGGVQLPAGSVELGEEPENAALRELFEETSIDRVELLERLCVLATDLGASNGVLSQSVVLSSSAACRDQEVGIALRRGLPVRVLAEEASASFICYEEFDYRVEQKAVISSGSGWVPTRVVARSLERIIFRARIERDGRSSWQHLADGQLLEIQWLPLRPKPALVEPQQGWLDCVYEQLLSIT